MYLLGLCVLQITDPSTSKMLVEEAETKDKLLKLFVGLAFHLLNHLGSTGTARNTVEMG